jgi:hypothetical protein
VRETRLIERRLPICWWVPKSVIVACNVDLIALINVADDESVENMGGPPLSTILLL